MGVKGVVRGLEGIHLFDRCIVDCRLLVVMERDFVSALQPLWLTVLSPDESECDRVSERDRLGLTPNLTTNRPLEKQEMGEEMRILCIYPCGT
jgi:hypothetical protein